MDAAPTLLHSLGMRPHQNWAGKVIKEAFTHHRKEDKNNHHRRQDKNNHHRKEDKSDFKNLVTKFLQ